MGTTTISLSNEAYKALKSQKKEGESFSDLILRTFGKGNPSAILAYLEESKPNLELADSVESASEKLRNSLNLERVEN